MTLLEKGGSEKATFRLKIRLHMVWQSVGMNMCLFF